MSRQQPAEKHGMAELVCGTKKLFSLDLLAMVLLRSRGKGNCSSWSCDGIFVYCVCQAFAYSAISSNLPSPKDARNINGAHVTCPAHPAQLRVHSYDGPVFRASPVLSMSSTHGEE